MEIDENLIFRGVLAFTVLEFVWESYLELRQRRVYKKHTQIPTELIGILSQKTFDKARLYAIDKSTLSFMGNSISFGVNMLILFSNGLVILWDLGDKIVHCFGYEGSELLHNIAFVFLFNIVRELTDLPSSIYSTFVVEEKHGFNSETVPFFIKDKIKMHIFNQIVLIILTCGITYLTIGEYFFIYLWLFVMSLVLFIYTIYPVYIAPLFDKFTLLPEGELRNEIEKLAEKVHFPLKKVFVVEGSKRSAHSNAYFCGLFNNKRIVLFDTLLKDYSPENAKQSAKGDEKIEEKEKKGCDTMEVLAVLAHELGHWKLNHVVKQLAFIQFNMLVVFIIFGMLFQYKPLYRAFGFYDSTPMLIGLIIVTISVCLPYFELTNFLLIMKSREYEFQADNFAKTLGRSHYLRCALIKLTIDNLGFPIYDPLFSMWHLSHPPLLERLQAFDKDD